MTYGKNGVGTVYVLEVGGHYKVGMTYGRLDRRIAIYKTHTPSNIVVHASGKFDDPVSVERSLNVILLGGEKSSGTDWQKSTPSRVRQVIEYIKTNGSDSGDTQETRAENATKTYRSIEVPFTQVANCVLNNKDISMRAKGLYAYLYSKPDGWNFSYLRIARDHTESKNTVLKALHELERTGYLQRTKLPSGRIDYTLVFDPVTKVGAQVANDQSVVRPKLGHVSKTDKERNTENTGTSIGDSNESRDVSEVMELFRPVNPTVNRLFKHRVQRQAIKNLLKIYPRPELDKIIAVLEQTNTHKFAPVITTPLQLETNIGKLIAYIKSKRWERESKGKDILGL